MLIKEYIEEIDEAKKQKSKKKLQKKISTAGKVSINKYKSQKGTLKRIGFDNRTATNLSKNVNFGDYKQKNIANKIIKKRYAELLNQAKVEAVSEIDNLINKYNLRSIKEDYLNEKREVISKKNFYLENNNKFMRFTSGSLNLSKAYELEQKNKIKEKDLLFYFNEKEKAFIRTMRDYLAGAYFFYAFSGDGNIFDSLKRYDEIKKKDVFTFINNIFSRFLLLSRHKKEFRTRLEQRENTLKFNIRDLFFNPDGTKKNNIIAIQKEAKRLVDGLKNGKLFFKPNKYFVEALDKNKEKIQKEEKQKYNKKFGDAFDKSSIPGALMRKLNSVIGFDRVNKFPDAKILDLMPNATEEQKRIFKRLANFEVKTGNYSATFPTRSVLIQKGIIVNGNKIDVKKLNKNKDLFGLPSKSRSVIFFKKENDPEVFARIYKSNYGKIIPKDGIVNIKDVFYRVGDKKTGYKIFPLIEKKAGNNFKYGFNINEKNKYFLWKKNPEITLYYKDFISTKQKIKDKIKKISNKEKIIKNAGIK